MSPDERFETAKDVLFRQMTDEVILLDLKKGAYYGLDAVGALAWSMLAAGQSIASIQTAIGEAFDGEADVIARDLSTLVADLCAKQLLQPRVTG